MVCISAEPCRAAPGRWNRAAWSAHSCPKWLGVPAPEHVAVHGWSPALQSCPCRANRCLLQQPRRWDVPRGLSGLRNCVGVLVMITNYSQPCVVPGASARSSWEIPIPFQAAQGILVHAKHCRVWSIFKSLDYLGENGLMLKDSNQHGGEQFGLGLAAGEDLALEAHPQASERALFSVQTAVLP